MNVAIEKVRNYFQTFGMAGRILEFDESSATVDLAAHALHTEGKRIAKTMAFKLKKNADKAILIVTAGDSKIANPKFKAQFGERAVMLSPDEVEQSIGHSVGGVCPFGINDGVNVYLDVSLKRFDTIFPACGSSNSAIELTIPELETYAGFDQWIDVCKDWE